ncbi:MAG: fibronectin type III domain-containing protein [Owenweeksia sp.]|nr:fibronectin type III domain-containing protein [Owenweeksia sp.]
MHILLALHQISPPANGWLQVITNGSVTGANNTALVALNFGSSQISIPANTRMGFFIDGDTRYQTGTSSDQTTYTDGTLSVIVDDDAAYGGGIPTPTFNPRRFLGSVIYELGVVGNCAPFTNFLIDSISGTAAKINWTPGSGNNSFFLEYGTTGFTPGNGTTITGTYPGSQPPVILSGLTAETNYDVYFGEICSNGADSVYFPTPQSFTTTKLCSPPSGLNVTNILDTTADVNWTYAGAAQRFEVIYGPPGFNPTTAGSVDTATASTYGLSGINPSTGYEVYVVAFCDTAQGYSDTIGPVFFFTNCAVANAPYTEKFDNVNLVASGSNTGNQLNQCWTSQPRCNPGFYTF